VKARMQRRHSVGDFESRVVRAGALDPAEVSAWEELCTSVDGLASPFFSPHFSRAMAAVRRHVFVCIIRRNAKPVAFLPFEFRNRGYYLLRAAERVGAEMSDYFGVVARPEIRLSPTTLLRLAGISAIEFTHLDESQVRYGLTGERPETGLVVRLRSGVSPWGEICRRERKFIADTERLERQLVGAEGPLRFVPEETGTDALERLMHWKGQQYVKTGRPNLFLARWRKELLHELSRTQMESCTGVLSSLYAGDHWLASHFGLRSRTVLHYWFPVYNPDFSRYSPGRLLEKYLLEYAASRGIEMFDLGAGDSSSKRKIANAEHSYYRSVWYARDVRGFVGRAVHSAAWRVAALQGS